MRYESRKEPLLPQHMFVWRLLENIAYAIGVVILSLLGGMVGYHYLGELSWVDSYVNASMILSGMGPVTELHNNSAKIFAGTYALFSGIIFLIIIGLVMAPIYHRFLHQFHLDEESNVDSRS